MPECERCGEPLQDPRDKDNRGWWRDHCMDCIDDLSDADLREDQTEEYVL